MSYPLWDNLDSALLGFTTVDGRRVAVYSYELAIVAFMEDGMDDEEAQEYLEFNVVCAYIGEQTPIWVYAEDDEELAYDDEE